jgi:pimeloyl-ACP methyl ester carboxylesterase
MLEAEDRYFNVGQISLHCIDSGIRGSGKPLLYVPGISGTAEDGRFFLEYFTDRRCLSLSMRGRGLSATPVAGYRFADHGRDLVSVIQQLGFEAGEYHLHGYSIGVMYVLAFLEATRIPPAGLILGDHPGRVGELPKGWADGFSRLVLGGRAVTENIRSLALVGIETSSEATSFYEALLGRQEDLPVLLLRGGKETSPPSPVSDDDELAFRRLFPSLVTRLFPDAGHFLRDTHRPDYLKAIADFLREADA